MTVGLIGLPIRKAFAYRDSDPTFLDSRQVLAKVQVGTAGGKDDRVEKYFLQKILEQ